MAYTVEYKYQKLQELIETYPEELRDMIKDGTLDSFKKYIEFYNPITKDLIGAYIHYQYCNGRSMFVSAEIANYLLEILPVLELQEIISYIEMFYRLTKYGYLYDTSRIQVRLHIGSMTIEDFLEEENENKKEIKKDIDDYLNLLISGKHFEQLYKELMGQYTRNERAIYRIKIKSLHCANHLYNLMELAEQIYKIAKKVYKIIEEKNPETIVNIESDKEDNHLKYYYFENERIDGAIIEEKNSQNKEKHYAITSTIQYNNTKGEPQAFAKIRIAKDENETIQVKGKRTGSCFSENEYDTDFLQHTDPELPIVLKRMKIGVETTLASIEKEPVKASELYKTDWVKEYRKSHKNNYNFF